MCWAHGIKRLKLLNFMIDYKNQFIYIYNTIEYYILILTLNTNKIHFL